MTGEIERVSEEILILLNISNKSITVDKIYNFMDEPHYLINASFNHLIRKGLVKGEFKEGKNYISRILHSKIAVIA